MIKLPKKQTPKESAHPEIHAVAVGWNECIDEVKRLNATAQPVNDEHARIAEALESLLWPNMAIGNKAIILCAINALRGTPAAPGGQDA